ncbi:MAG: hypothetical protein HYT71_00835 [Candidatus Aenigmarchaeota archaeon]|nr:hypothetical protein [Candidatus Aenigmarchaeota archaeon]
MKIKHRNQDFMIAKNHVSLQMLLRGWIIQDLFFEGGPDLIAAKKHDMIRIKVRYATAGDGGHVFSAGGLQEKIFFEVCEGSDLLVLVCMDDDKNASGFYIFNRDESPKAKTFLHPPKGPFPKYRGFYNNWKPLQWK